VEVKNLLQVTELKLLCQQTYIEKIDVGPKGFLITFYKNHFPKPDHLLKWLQTPKVSPFVKLRSDQKLFVTFDLAAPTLKRYVVVRKFLMHIREFVMT